MTFEADFQAMLATATGLTVYWDTTPPNFKMGDEAIIVLQQTGGKAQFYVEKDLVPDYKHARVMTTIIGKSRAQVAPIARQVQDIIAKSDYPSEPYGAPVGEMTPDLGFYTSQQQFGVWFADP